MGLKDIREKRKENKRKHIISLFRKYGKLSKIQVKKHSGYAMSTVIDAVDHLYKKSLLKKIGPCEERGRGRPSYYYGLNEDSLLYAGCTFTMSGIYSMVMSFSGKILCRNQTTFDAPLTRKIFIKKLQEQISTILNNPRIKASHIESLGLALPGYINPERGILETYTFMPFLDGTDFKKVLHHNDTPQKMFFTHNVSAFLYYFLINEELINQYEKILLINLRSGLSLGEIYQGEIVTGRGELGHVRVADKGIQCTCGRKDCLDVYLSHQVISNALSHICKKHNISFQGTKDPSLLPIDEIVKLYQSGHSHIKQDLDRRFGYLAGTILDIINVNAPDLIIFSGELFNCFKDPVAAMRSLIHENFEDNGYIHNYRNTEFAYYDLSTEIAADGICHMMLQNDFSFMTE